VSWDESLFRAINGLAGQSPVLDWLAFTLSDPDTLWLPGILLGCYWIWLSWREALIAGPVLAGLIGLLDFLGAQVKHLIARPRPCVALSDIQQLQACGKVFAFPSNHAINTAAAAAFLHVLYPRSGWVSWPLVILVGLSRVYLGAHYVTDVIGGWMMGGLGGAAIAWALLHWTHMRERTFAAKPQAGQSIS